MRQPTVVFIHGVLNDHSVWDAFKAPLENDGYAVMAIDLPGHGQTKSAAPHSVEAGTDNLLALLDASGIETVALVGHSFGSLIALEAAARAPKRVTHLALLGTASPMRVSPVLLETSLKDPLAAIDLVNTYSHSQQPPPPPGLMQRVFAANPSNVAETNVFHTGLNACNNYKNALSAINSASSAMLFIVGQQDKMTPPKFAQPLIDAATASGKQVKVVTLETGHSMMTEAPAGVLMALQAFLKSPTRQSAVV